MRTPLAWHNLMHAKIRTAAAVAGVTFAVVLVFMQLGFLGAVYATAAMVYDALDFDLVIRSAKYRCMSDPRSLPRARLHQAASLPDVARVTPFHIGLKMWQNPVTGRKRIILAMGVKPGATPFVDAELQQKSACLTAPEMVLIDRQCRPEFGPHNGRRYGDGDLGGTAEVTAQKIRIAGHYALGAGFEADGSLVANEMGICRIEPGRDPDDVSLGLVKLTPGADLQAAARRLAQLLPDDVRVVTREQALAYESDIWIRQRSAGVIFQMGVAVALVVGTAIVYQILSSDVTKHLREYATLRAMGYTGRFLGWIVLQEALLLSLFGFVPGLLLALVIYRITSYITWIPVDMTVSRMLFVLALSVAMCSLSGLGALRKVRSAQPADLF